MGSKFFHSFIRMETNFYSNGETMTPNATVKLATLRHLVESHVVHEAAIIGGRGGWSVAVRYGHTERTLAGKDGKARLFTKLETAAKQLLGIGLVSFAVNAVNYEDVRLRAPRSDRSQAMKDAHEYINWLKAEVDATSRRVASGEAELFTEEEADARGAAKRTQIMQRRNGSG